MTSVRNLQGRAYRFQSIQGGQGTGGYKCCNSCRIFENARVMNRRKLNGSSEEMEMKEKKMLALWEKMKNEEVQSTLCTDGFKVQHVNSSLATLVSMKVRSLKMSMDLSVLCCFKSVAPG